MNGPLLLLCWIGGGGLSAALLYRLFHVQWFQITKAKPAVRISPEWLHANRDEIVHHAIKGSRSALQARGTGK